jgi:hypothetical protein
MPREDDRNEEIQSLRLSIPTRESDPAPRRTRLISITVVNTASPVRDI